MKFKFKKSNGRFSRTKRRGKIKAFKKEMLKLDGLNKIVKIEKEFKVGKLVSLGAET